MKLVAIHGLGSASTAWDLIRPDLAVDFEFITFDLPGHGDAFMLANKTMKPEILAQIVKNELNAIGIENFHLIGNSLGGWICLELASQFPNNVDSVTAVAPAGLWLKPKINRDGELAISRYLAKATYRAANLLSRFKAIRALGFKLVSPQWEKFSVKTCAQAAIAMGSASGYFTLWDAFLGNRFEKNIDSKIPVTIIFGDSDNTLPADSCQEKSLAPSHAKWIVLPQSGHAPMWDQVTEVIEITKNTIAATA